MVSSQARRDQVALAMERGHSQRQACELIELPRSILQYRSVRIERDTPEPKDRAQLIRDVLRSLGSPTLETVT